MRSCALVSRLTGEKKEDVEKKKNCNKKRVYAFRERRNERNEETQTWRSGRVRSGRDGQVCTFPDLQSKPKEVQHPKASYAEGEPGRNCFTE